MLWHVIITYDFPTRDVQPTQPASELWVCNEYYEFILNVYNRRWSFIEQHMNKCIPAMKASQNYLHPISYYLTICHKLLF